MATVKIHAMDRKGVVSAEATADAKVYRDSARNYPGGGFHGIEEEIEIDEESLIVVRVSIQSNWVEKGVEFKSLNKRNQQRIISLLLREESNVEVEDGDEGYDYDGGY